MKTNYFTALLIALFATAQLGFAQKTVTVTVDDEDISNNLDLYGIAYAFGEAEDLADFEARINDPDAQISNLDLNNDGHVDYLRVVEAMEKNVHVVVVQAVLAEDIYQDVATVVVEKEKKSKSVSVQVVGDPYIYGTNYIIEPVYVTTPVIYTYFWRPAYRCYVSPYYWGYYPVHFHYRPCIHVNVYRHHMHRYRRAHHAHMSFHYADKPRCNYTNIYVTISHNDYATRHPNNSFSARNNGATNRREIDAQRVSSGTRTPVNSRTAVSNTTTTTRGTSATKGRVATSSTTTGRSSGTSTRTASGTSTRATTGTSTRSSSNSSATRSNSSSSRNSSAVSSGRSSSSSRSSATRSGVSGRSSSSSSSNKSATRSSSSSSSVRKSSGSATRSSSSGRSGSSSSSSRSSSRSSSSSSRTSR